MTPPPYVRWILWYWVDVHLICKEQLKSYLSHSVCGNVAQNTQSHSQSVRFK